MSRPTKAARVTARIEAELAAWRISRAEAIRVLWRFRRAALRAGDIRDAASCLSSIWSCSLDDTERQLRYARTAAKEHPWPLHFVDYGHALVLAGKERQARRAYAEAIERAARARGMLRKPYAWCAAQAREAIACLDRGESPPFVDHVLAGRLPPEAQRDRALRARRAEVENAPSALAYQKLGIALELMSRFDDAKAAYHKAAKLAASEGDSAVHDSLQQKLRILRRGPAPALHAKRDEGASS